MAIPAGTRLGPYEIVSAIGAGGMGEVYRARDTRLNRDVALKVLPEVFARDTQRMARFEREAKLLASLNHSNIAAIYGLEESGPIFALVMELVEGPTLAERIKGGAIPVDEALPIARQVADAVEYAHDKNVIHRDLKPANIKITAEGVVKVLDFGLAKALLEDPTEGDMSNSPTLSVAATRQGVILGTAAYMAPEQARGKTADRRADVWAFGVVLYEMLTGDQAFKGEDLSLTLASVMKSEPDWRSLPEDLSPTLRALLRRCLQKDPKQRVQAMGDVRLAMEGAFETAVAPNIESAGEPRPPLWRRAMPVVITACVTAVVAGGAVWLTTRRAPAPVVRSTIATSGESALSIQGLGRDVAISPDGSRIVYRGNRQLLVRALDQLEPMVLGGLGSPQGVFFSPDGQWIGFADTNVLKKVAITGGPAVTILSLEGFLRGAAWDSEGSVLIATTNVASGLSRVSEGGGEPEVLTAPNRESGETDHLWPELLPGGQAVLFTITTSGGTDNSQVAVLDLRTGAQKILVRGGSHAHYVESGHLVYAAAGALRAVRFDLESLETAGTSVLVVPQVFTTNTGGANFDVARNGTLVYLTGGPRAAERTLVWLDREGREEAIKAPPRAYLAPRLSPDGTRIALDIRDQENDIWVWDLARETLARLTFDPGIDRLPVWTPDSQRIIFGSDRSGAINLYWQAADNTGTVERLTESPNTHLPWGVSPDGTRLVFGELGGVPSSADLMLLTVDNDRRAEPLLQSQMYAEGLGQISPDGRWLLYQSNESEQNEIYVRPYPDVNSGRWQVSTMGGTQPLWARSGQELFYVSLGGELMRVAVEQGPARLESGGQAWRAGTPAKLFDNAYVWLVPGLVFRPYDISPDGRRFLAFKPVAADETGASSNLIVVQNWFEELKQRVPAGTK